ncbi:hypothetical protein MRX96_047705 [Rhipicephalus microplus]
MKFSLNPLVLSRQIREMGDPRTRDYPLVMDPLFVVTLVAAYLYFVKVAGPHWMKDREPFRILNVVRVYNLALVLINVRFLYLVLRFTYLPGGHYNLWCQGITGHVTDEMQEYYRTGYVYTISRYMDLLDTCLLRSAQEPVLGMCLNVFIHIIMYSYYFMATLGPGVRKYLWWKKYLTTMQIIQFVLIMMHMSIPLFVDCGFPKQLIIVGNLQTFLILCLFVNFYIKTYVAKPNHPVLRDHNGTMDTVVEPVKNGKSE